jgi:ALMS motif
MREQTERKYKNLAEIQKREELKKREEEHKTNRLMAQIFKRVLCIKVIAINV